MQTLQVESCVRGPSHLQEPNSWRRVELRARNYKQRGSVRAVMRCSRHVQLPHARMRQENYARVGVTDHINKLILADVLRFAKPRTRFIP